MRITLSTFALLLSAGSAIAASSLRSVRQRQAVFRHQAALEPSVVETKFASAARKTSWLKIKDPRAKAYEVDGKGIPEVEFDVGPSWAGLMPISARKNESRKLYFWFFPAKQPSKDLIFWTNGGPGCSSLEGFLQENGPISWPPGVAKPMDNPYSWTNLSNVLWVEQPVGTGFSQGTPDIHNNDELAAEVAGFLAQFLDVFKEIQGSNFYITGESYAGLYVPYIANYLYEHPKAVNLKTKGIWIADPSIADDYVTEYVPAVPFLNKFKDVFALNATFVKQINAAHARCGYKAYLDRYLVYPPSGRQPIAPEIKPGCATFDEIFEAAVAVNPAFNIYRITDMPSILWDVLGFPGSVPNEQTKPLYFDRADVKKAINAPNVPWGECSDIDVYVDGKDLSLPSIVHALPNVIEKSVRTVILHGLLDMVLLSNGTRLAVQNMTWNGALGFQEAPKPGNLRIKDGLGVPFESYNGGQDGVVGSHHTERNLTYVEINLSGHMVPQFAPATGYKTVQYLLGQRKSL